MNEDQIQDQDQREQELLAARQPEDIKHLSPGESAGVSAAARSKGEGPVSEPMLPVIGLESEMTVFLAGKKVLPENVFKSPQAIVRQRMMRRPGRSFHMPSGGAVYFDTGVIEVATPIIEIAEGCCIQATRSLWEQIYFLRRELDAWEQEQGKEVRLEGFSAHYNISIPLKRRVGEEAMSEFARLLTCILCVPTLLLAANRSSTGVGVRPRGNRLEITADFTPDPDLMIATCAFLTGAVLEVMDWPRHTLSELKRRRIPVIEGFEPRKHTSRKGWLARDDCFPRSPFTADVTVEDWQLKDGRTMSLRGIGQNIARRFRQRVRSVSDAETAEHVYAVLGGRARSLLDFPGRPPEYEDVGRTVNWGRRTTRTLPRSAYEEVIHRILAGRPIRIGSAEWVPVRMKDWYEIIFRNSRTGERRVFDLDDLVKRKQRV